MNINCPVCSNSPLLDPMLAANTRAVPLNCPRCGPFIVTDEALSMLLLIDKANANQDGAKADEGQSSQNTRCISFRNSGIGFE
jgi:hypothetical protein